MYLNRTKERVERFLAKRGTAFQKEVQFLNKKTMQMKHAQVKAVLKDLEKEEKVKISIERVGKRKFVRVVWCKKSS